LQDDINFLEQKLKIMETREQDLKQQTSKKGDLEGIKKHYEDQLKNHSIEIYNLKANLADKEKLAENLTNKNSALEVTIENLKRNFKMDAYQKTKSVPLDNLNDSSGDIQKSIAGKEKKIFKLQQKNDELEEEKANLEKELEMLRRMVNNTMPRDKYDSMTKHKNQYDVSRGMSKAKILRLEGELIQKDIKIEYLNQKIAYLKQKETSSKRVRENLNEFHKDLFNSFQVSRKRHS